LRIDRYILIRQGSCYTSEAFLAGWRKVALSDLAGIGRTGIDVCRYWNEANESNKQAAVETNSKTWKQYWGIVKDGIPVATITAGLFRG
jgi:hypothetical protein